MHPLAGTREKIIRAKNQIEALEFATHRFFTREIGSAIVGKFDPKTRTHDLEVEGEAPDYPLVWGAAIGEIAHDLRSALDGIVYQLALLCVARPRRTQFPVFLKGRTKSCRGSCPRGVERHFRCHSSGMIGPLRGDHRAMIERLQPYKRGNGKRRNPLWILQELNNTDKHRLIPLVGGYVVSELSATFEKPTAGPIHLKIGVQSKRGAKVIKGPIPAEEMDMEFHSPHQVSFGEGCEAVEGLPVFRTLSVIADHVESINDSFLLDFG